MTSERRVNIAPAQLDESQHQRLARLADLIAPRLGDMPSASDVGLMNGGIQDVLRLRPDLATKLPGILTDCPDDPSNRYLEKLNACEPEALSVLVQIVAGAYYMDPRVRTLIGYDGQKELPINISQANIDGRPSI